MSTSRGYENPKIAINSKWQHRKEFCAHWHGTYKDNTSHTALEFCKFPVHLVMPYLRYVTGILLLLARFQQVCLNFNQEKSQSGHFFWLQALCIKRTRNEGFCPIVVVSDAARAKIRKAEEQHKKTARALFFHIFLHTRYAF